MYSEKISILNFLFNFLEEEKDKKKYIYTPLEKAIKNFGSSYLYVKDFIIFLRKHPTFMYKIIKCASKKDLDDSFIYFISNNFYEDIFTHDAIHEDFLNLAENLLNDEINNIKSLNDFENVMNESNIFILFNGLKYNTYIKNYFDYLLSNIILEYEKSVKNKNKLNFTIEDLSVNINENNNESNNTITENSKKEKSKNNDNNKNNIYYKTVNIFDIIYYNEFSRKYLLELSKQKLTELLEVYKYEENMQIYLNDKIKLVEGKNNIFSINIFIDELVDLKDYEAFLNQYQINFNTVIDMINNIINKIYETIDFMPFSIKYISKIIYRILINKFNTKESKFQIIKYLSKFFFIKIFQYYFLYPELNLIFDSTIISQETKDNLIIIFNIFKKYISFELFENAEIYSNYLPFNIFFIENSSKLFKIYEKILDIDLPESSQSIVGVIKSIYSYSIFFNINNLTTLLNIIKHNKEYFFGNKTDDEENEGKKELEMIYERLKLNKEIFKSLKEKDNTSINYYVFYEIYYSEKIKNIIFNSINTLTNNFRLPETEKNTQNFELIHTKNLISDILFSIDLFNLKKISNNINLNNIKEILEQLSIYYSTLNSIPEKNLQEMEIEDEEDDETIHKKSNINQSSLLPIEWYIDSLIIYLDKIDNIYKDDNYKGLFDSLNKDLNESIKKYNFEVLSQIREKLKNIYKYLKEYNIYQKLYKSCYINSKLKKFIKNEIIEVKIKYKYNAKEKIFKIKNKQINNSSVFKNIFKKKNKYDFSLKCNTIYEFCKNFPDLTKIIKFENIDNLFNEDEINLESSISGYFDIIKEHIENIFSKSEKKIAYSKIQKYIFENIYDKLISKENNQKDIDFNTLISNLSQIEHKHLDLNNINIDKYILLINKYFNELDKENNPDGKFKSIVNIFELIKNNIIINKKDISNFEYLKQICASYIIKNKPERLISNLKYLQMFLTKNNEENPKVIYFNILKSCVNDINNLYNNKKNNEKM